MVLQQKLFRTDPFSEEETILGLCNFALLVGKQRDSHYQEEHSTAPTGSTEGSNWETFPDIHVIY